MDISRYLRLLLKKWWIIVILEIVALAITFYYVKNQPTSYSTQATFLLNLKGLNTIYPYASTDTTFINNLAENYNLILKSDNFVNRVAQELNNGTSPEQLKKAYSSKLSPNSLLYVITATSSTPEQAQKIANTVTKIFLSDDFGQIKGSSEDVLATTTEKQREQLKILQADIDDTNQQLRQLQAENQTPEVVEQTRSLRARLRDLIDIETRLLIYLNQATEKDLNASRNFALLLDSAKLPVAPNDTGLVRNLAFASGLALVLTVLVLVLLDYLGYTIRTSDELARVTSYPTLAQVPVIRPMALPQAQGFAADGALSMLPSEIISSGTLDPMLITATEFKSSASEAYRTLRTNLLFSTLTGSGQAVTPNSDSPLAEDSKLILIASTLPDEGRSLTAANLAIAFAQVGKKVILVDSDLRQPILHELFGLTNEPGFSNLVLSGGDNISAALQTTPVANLQLLSAGALPPNPSEMLTSYKAQRLIANLRTQAELIIFDSPAANLVTDAAILANQVDEVLLVVAAGSTRRDVLVKTLGNLKKVGAKISGTVLNRVEITGQDYYPHTSHASNKNRGNAVPASKN